MSNQEKVMMDLDGIIEESKITWGKERAHDLGSVVEKLMQRHEITPYNLTDLDQDDFELAA